MRVVPSPLGELVSFPPALRWSGVVPAVPPAGRVFGVSDRCDRPGGALAARPAYSPVVGLVCSVPPHPACRQPRPSLVTGSLTMIASLHSTEVPGNLASITPGSIRRARPCAPGDMLASAASLSK